MRPNFEQISSISRKFDTIGIHAFALDNGKIICRNFAPLYDIPEESATGTANCALACYLYHHNIIRRKEFEFEQGYSLNSPSQITVLLETQNDDINNVIVGGTGYICN
jgi:PhzF family phenazine biosynthesis protein